jgi:hypothetical protein
MGRNNMAKSNYFNSAKVEALLSQYKITKDIKYRNEAMIEIMLIIKAIINVYRFWRFAEREDLESEAACACLKAIESFDPITWAHKKDLAHRFFSLVVKKHLLFITLKESKYKKRNYFEESTVVQDLQQVKQAPWENMFSCLDMNDIPKFFEFLNNCLFLNTVKKLRIVKLLHRYIGIQTNSFNKKEFINYTKSFGITHSYIRKVLKEIQDSSALFYKYYTHSKQPLL